MKQSKLQLLVLTFFFFSLQTYAGKISWFQGPIEEAFQEAKARKKPLFVFLTAKWCPPCNYLKSHLFPAQKFQEVIQDYVPYYLDSDAPGAQEFAQKWKLQGYPNMVIFNDRGQKLMNVSNAAMKTEDLIRVFSEARNLSRPLEEMVKAIVRGERLELTPGEWKLISAQEWNQINNPDLIQNYWSQFPIYEGLHDQVPKSMPLERNRLFFSYLNAIDTLENRKIKRERVQHLEELDKILENPKTARQSIDFLKLSIVELLTEPGWQREKYISTLLKVKENFRRQSQREKKTTSLVVQRLHSYLDLIRYTLKERPRDLGKVAKEFSSFAQKEFASYKAPTPNEESLVLGNIVYPLITLGNYPLAKKFATIGLKRAKEKYTFALYLATIAKKQGQTREFLNWQKRAYRYAKGRSTRILYGNVYLKSLLQEFPKEVDEIITRLKLLLMDYFRNDDDLAGIDYQIVQSMVEIIYEWSDLDESFYQALEKMRPSLLKECKIGENQEGENCIRVARALGNQRIMPKISEIPLVKFHLEKYKKDGKEYFALVFRNRRGVHTYYKDPGDVGLPIRSEFQTLEGKTFPVALRAWPTPKKFVEEGNLTTYGYVGKYAFFFHKDKISYPFKIQVNYLACADQCIPGKGILEILGEESFVKKSPREFLDQAYEDVVKDSQDIVGEKSDEIHHEEQKSLYVFLLLAFIGGFILNFMPCVLPVISLKLFGIIKMKKTSHKEILTQNLSYTAGVLTCFLLLGGVVMLLQSLGLKVGWGFQLQSPVFVFGMILLLFLMSLNFFDLFEVPHIGATFLTKKLAKARTIHIESYLSGLLATALATPCSAPFLGTALTFAFLSSNWTTFLIFTCIGLGLSFPFLVIGFFPRSIKFLPKPGNWMNHLRYVLGFFMILTATWAYHVLNNLVDNKDIIFNLNILLGLIFVSFFFYKDMLKKNRFRRAIFLLPLLMTFYTTQKLIHPPIHETGALMTWQPWSREVMNQYKRAHELTFIDVTAEWCMTCKVNEAMVLDRSGFKALVEEHHLKLLKADWTRRDESITDFLKNYGRVAVPAYFIQDTMGRIHPLGEVITLEEIRKKLAEIDS